MLNLEYQNVMKRYHSNVKSGMSKCHEKRKKSIFVHFVLLRVLLFVNPSCDVHCDFRIKRYYVRRYPQLFV